ncbi:MAG: hypothetical protein CMH54_07705 [Myxococcales bacterium]|nr:hypothetical protein [Myxococcales bacterium]
MRVLQLFSWIILVLFVGTYACGTDEETAVDTTTTNTAQPDTSTAVDTATGIDIPVAEDTTQTNCSTIGELKALQLPANSDEPTINIDHTLCGVTVTYVYNEGFFIQDGPNGEATEVYMGANSIWPFARPTPGDVIDLHATQWGAFKGHLEIKAVDTVTLVGSTNINPYILDLSSGIVPTDEHESRVVTLSGATLTSNLSSNEKTISYGNGAEIQLYSKYFPNSVCAGATFDIIRATVVRHDNTLQLKNSCSADSCFWYASDDIANVNLETCEETVDYSNANWDFEDWTYSDPPDGFIKEGDGFTAIQDSEIFYGETGSSCELHWTSTNNQDFRAGYFVAATPNTDYTVSVRVMDNDPNGRVRLALDFYNAGKVKIGETSYASTYSENSADWAKYSHTATTPEGTAFVRGFIRMYDVANFGDTDSAIVNIDNWATSKGTTTNEGTIPDDGNGTNNNNATDICAPNPCINGTCIDDAGIASCDCTGTGYEGDTCEIDIDECTTGADDCDASELCENIDGGFVCSDAPIVSYETDAKPVFVQYCNNCHSWLNLGGHNIASNYDDAFKPASSWYSQCAGLNMGECSLVLMLDGSMPINDIPSDDPGLDIIQAWIDGGMQP